MGVDIKLRLYDFPSKIGSGLQSIICKDTDIDGNYLLKQVSQLLKVSSERLTLVFCGKPIRPNTRLKATGFRSGQLIQVLFKSIQDEVTSPDIDAKRLEKIMTHLHHIFCGKRPDLRRLKNNVSKLLTDSKRLQKIVESIPGLQNEPILIDILRHPDVFGHVVAPANCKRILSHNKRLGAAILLVWDNTPSTKSLKIGQIRPVTNNRVSNDRDEYNDDDDDDDEMDYDPSYPTSSTRPSSSRSSTNIITSQHLAQALSMANSPQPGRVFPSPLASTLKSPQTGSGSAASGSGSGSQADANLITPDVFSLAMQQAMSRSPSNPPQPQGSQTTPAPELNSEVLRNGLEQLRAMGITDERASKKALVAAGGNVEAAVNIIFASGLNDL